MNSAASSDRQTVKLAFAFEMALAAVAIVIGRVCGIWPLELLRWSLGDLLLGLLAAMPLVALLFVAMWRPIGPLRRMTSLVDELVQVLFAGATPLDIAAVSAAAGFGEELLFRGLVQTGAEKLSGSTVIAVLVSALVFGAAHPITRSYAVVAAVIGGYFGWLLVASGNLLVPMVAHGAYDLVAILYFHRPSDVESELLVEE